MREFTKDDYMGLAGAEPCSDGSRPRIADVIIKTPRGEKPAIITVAGGPDGDYISIIGDGEAVPFNELSLDLKGMPLAFVLWVAARLENAGALRIDDLREMGFELLA